MRTQLTKTALTAGFVLALAFTFSCSSDKDDDNSGDSPGTGNGGGGVPGPTVNYGNETYKTVVIGSQTWMARNLNYDVPGNDTDVCYGNDPANCTKYGRLYDWATAMTVCPSGWHLPSDAEWDVLENYAGGSSTAGGKLKATSGCSNNGNGTDAYGFAALPGGYGESDGNFYVVGLDGYWWCSSGALCSFYRSMSCDFESVYRGSYSTYDHLYSVRCLQD